MYLQYYAQYGRASIHLSTYSTRRTYVHGDTRTLRDAVGNFSRNLARVPDLLYYCTAVPLECERMEPLRVGVDRRTLMPGTIKKKPGLSCSWNSTPGEINNNKNKATPG